MPYEDKPEDVYPSQQKSRFQGLIDITERLRQKYMFGWLTEKDVPQYSSEFIRIGKSSVAREEELPPVVEKFSRKEPLPGTVDPYWDEFNRPYYGGQSPLQEWWRGLQYRWGSKVDDPRYTMPDPRDELDQRDPLAPLKNAGALIQHMFSRGAWEWGGKKETKEPTALTYAGRAASEFGSFFIAGLQTIAEEQEKVFAGVRRWSDLDRFEHPMPDYSYIENPALRMRMERKAWSSPLRYVLNHPWEDVKKEFATGYTAGRVLYTEGFANSGIFERFCDEVESGEVNPYIRSQELMNPWAEAAGQMLFDPTILAGLATKSIWKLFRLQSAFKYFKPPKVIEKIIRGAGALDDTAIASKLADVTVATMNEASTVGTKLDDLAKSNKVWELTTGGKRFVVARDVGQVVLHAMNQAGNDADNVLEIIEAMSMLVSKNADEVATGATRLLRLNAPAPFFSRPGLRAGYVMRELLTAGEDVIDTTRFMKSLRKAQQGGVSEVIKLVDKRVGQAVEKMFPTVLERGKDVSPTVRAIARFHDMMYTKGPYRVINNFFASIYMGMSPGYAFRNLWVDTATLFFDEGLGAVFRTPTGAVDNATKWMGGVRPRGLEGFGGMAAGEDVGRKGITKSMLRLANVFEEWTAARIQSKVIPDTVMQLLNYDKNLALPVLDDLIAAGLDPTLARRFKTLIFEHAGDSKAALAQFMKEYRSGIVELYRGVGLLDFDDIRLLEEYNLMDEFIRLTNNSQTYDEFLEGLTVAFDNVIRKGDDVVRDVATISRDAEAIEVIQNMSEARNAGHFMDEEIELATDYFQANHESNAAWEDLIRRAQYEVGYSLSTRPGKYGIESADDVQRMLDDIISKVAFDTGEETYTFRQLLDGTFGTNAKRAAQKLTDDTWAIYRQIDTALAKESPKEELIRLWNLYGLPGDVPTTIDIRKMKDLLWQTYYKKQRVFWQNYRDLMAVSSQSLLDEFGKLGFQFDSGRATWLADRARAYDGFLSDSEIWFNLKLALRDVEKGVEGGKAAAARLYAHKFGFPSVTDTGAQLDDNMLLNIVNKHSGQTFSKLDDVPPEVSRQAFLHKAVVDRLGELAPTEKATSGLMAKLDELIERVGKVTPEEAVVGLTEADHEIIRLVRELANPEEQALLSKIARGLSDSPEGFPEFAEAMKSVVTRLEVESKPVRLRLGVANVQGAATAEIDKIVDQARALEAAGDMAAAEAKYQEAVQPAVDYLKQVIEPRLVDKLEFSYGRWNGINEPTIYFSTKALSEDELFDILTTMNKVAGEKFGQNALLAYGELIDDTSIPLGNIRRGNGLVSRVEASFQLTFKDRIDVKIIDDALEASGLKEIVSYTLTPDRKAIEIVNVSWYNDITTGADEYVRKVGQFTENLNQRGLLQASRRGVRETWAFALTGQVSPDEARLGVTAKSQIDDLIAALPEKEREIAEKLARGDYGGNELASYIQDALAGKLKKPQVTPHMKPHPGEQLPSEARLVYESTQGLEGLRDRIAQNVQRNWGRTTSVRPNERIIRELYNYEKIASGRIAEARLIANKVGIAARDFILHAYPAKRNFDLGLSYVYPFHFWYNRTYAKWLLRIATEPQIVAAYAKYKTLLSRIHADSPDWWKYNLNTNDVLGWLGLRSDNPLYFNLEQTLNPLNGLTGVDFNDPRKRVNWWTSVLDDLGKFGPSIWTPYSLATAVILKSQGEEDAAARWSGRVIPQTGVLKSVSALLGAGSGWEIDPGILLFADGLDVYERRRVGRALQDMMAEGLITQAEAEEAAYTMKGMAWEQAKTRAALGRAWGQVSSFLLGAGFRMRPESDKQIDIMDDYLNRFYEYEGNLSPREVQETFNWFRDKFPFFDTVILSRKRGEERDRTYAYSVLGRIPPGQKTDLLKSVGLTDAIIEKFYEEKGHIWDWAAADREKFMVGVMELGGILETPDTTTRDEWLDASDRRKALEGEISERFGEDITIKMDIYFQKRAKSTSEGNEYLDLHPELGEALDFRNQGILEDSLMMKYYGSIGNVRSYLVSDMYDRIAAEVGEDIWDKWDTYYSIYDKDERKAYYEENKDTFARYRELKDMYEKAIAERLVYISRLLPERPYPAMRELPEQPSTAQEEALRVLEEPQLPEYYNFEWEDWQQFIDRKLAGLVEDFYLGGEEMPELAINALDSVAEDLGIDPDLMFQLMGQSLGIQGLEAP